MKAELADAPNEFEIFDFISYRTKTFLGIEKFKKRLPICKDDIKKEQSALTVEEREKIERQPLTMDDLPDKVDTFINYINKFYFDGKLEGEGKEMFMKGLGGRGGKRAAGKVFNCDDASGQSPPSELDQKRRPRRRISISS